MPPFEEMDRHQEALLWPPTATTGSDGQPTYDVSLGAVVCLRVRWENVRRLGTDDQGNPVAIDATVLSTREIPIGSLMWEGGLRDLTGTSEAPTSRIMIVVGQERARDLKGRIVRREYQLQHWRGTLGSGG